MADKRQQEQETVTQEVQEEITDRIRIKFTEIPPEQMFLHDLAYADKEKFATLTPEQQKEWIEFQRDSFKRLPETIGRIKKSMSQMMKTFMDYEREARKTWISSIFEEVEWVFGRFQKMEQVEQLEPFIIEELKLPEYDGLEIADLLEDIAGESEEPLSSDLWQRIIDGAKNRKTAALLPSVNIKRADIAEYPLDKINSCVWNMFSTDSNGQIKFAIPVQRNNTNNIIKAYYSINFEGIEEKIRIIKRLTQLDKRIYIAISALHAAGNDIITATQIHYAMGFTTRPNSNQLDKYMIEIQKMVGAVMYLDNKDEAEAYNYPHFKYFGPLLPVEGLTVDINGKMPIHAIKILNELPLVKYAKLHKQITTIDIKYLQSPFNKTENNLKIEDYMIERISRARSGNQPKKILKAKLFNKIDATDPKKKERALKIVTMLMKFYKDSGFVNDYDIDDTSISFSL